ncbi:MAG: hypothetical protein Q9217_003713 [Psora testacea]
MSTQRPQNDTQISPGLPGVQRHITGHDESGKSIIESSTPGHWTSLFDDTMAFNVVYSTSEMPVSLNDRKDIKTHEDLMSSGKLGLVQPNGTVCRIVDFGPGAEPLVHRTQSLDYGVVLEGEIEMILDDGVKSILKRGDVAVQRATTHGWRNTSITEWARMLFVLQDCQKVIVNGKEVGEDVSEAGDEKDLLAAQH